MVHLSMPDAQPGLQVLLSLLVPDLLAQRKLLLATTAVFVPLGEDKPEGNGRVSCGGDSKMLAIAEGVLFSSLASKAH